MASSIPIPVVAYGAPVIIDAAELAGAADVGGCSGTCCTGGNGVVDPS